MSSLSLFVPGSLSSSRHFVSHKIELYSSLPDIHEAIYIIRHIMVFFFGSQYIQYVRMKQVGEDEQLMRCTSGVFFLTTLSGRHLSRLGDFRGHVAFIHNLTRKLRERSRKFVHLHPYSLESKLWTSRISVQPIFAPTAARTFEIKQF